MNTKTHIAASLLTVLLHIECGDNSGEATDINEIMYTEATTCTQRLTMEEVVDMEISYCLPCGEIATGAAIAMQESSLDPSCTLINSTTSIDRGLWQINSHWHPEVAASCAYDKNCSTQAMVGIQKRRGWSEWAAYPTRYLKYMDKANAAFSPAKQISCLGLWAAGFCRP